MVLLVFMIDFVKIALPTDRVRPSQIPETWNIGPLVRFAAVLGALMLVELLALIAFGWRRFGLIDDPARLQAFTFQLLLFFALFSVVSVGERRAFHASRPSALLAAALLADAVTGLLIGLLGLGEMGALQLRALALLALSTALLALVPNDWVKAALPRRRGAA